MGKSCGYLWFFMGGVVSRAWAHVSNSLVSAALKADGTNLSFGDNFGSDGGLLCDGETSPLIG